MRTFRLIAVLAVSLATLSPASALASDITSDQHALLPSLLHEQVIVNERVVRLGDLFTNAGDKAEVAVAYAPEPGKRLTFDARWLYRVASAYRLNWRPVDGTVQATVERDSIAIPVDLIKDEILFALSDQGVGPNVDLDISGSFQQIFIPASNDPVMRVDAVDYRPGSGRFVAVISVGGGSEIQQMRISGRAFETVEVPVLAARVQRGEPIGKHHIQWIKAKSERIQSDVLLDASDIIGMTPRRGLRAGQPIRANDVTRPIIVERNGLVTIFHKVLNMTLTAQGRALHDASMGDIVQIKNSQSSMIIDAEVVGPGRVVVRTPEQPQLSMNLN